MHACCRDCDPRADRGGGGCCHRRCHLEDKVREGGREREREMGRGGERGEREGGRERREEMEKQEEGERRKEGEGVVSC